MGEHGVDERPEDGFDDHRQHFRALRAVGHQRLGQMGEAGQVDE